MTKKSLKPTTALFPIPTVLVTCQDQKGRSSIITISFIGVLNADPPMIGIAVRPNRYSYEIMKEAMEFVVNIPTEKMLKVTDFCGVASGRDVNKFEATGLTPISSEKVKVPSIVECPVNLECAVKQILPLGSHDLLIGEIVAFRADEAVLRPNLFSVDLHKILPFAYCPGGPGSLEYWGLREPIGIYGFTKGKL
jgi:flavin reductase (DIM6/NTAB) family NADH-FMN oxidoreductase RutF